MNEHDIQNKVSEILGEIRAVPVPPVSLNGLTAEKLAQLADPTVDAQARLNVAAGSLQESLDYLRLAVKYLLFDLEATRRENFALRKILQEEIENEE